MTGHNGAGSHFQFRNYSFDARTGNPVNENTVFYPAAQVNVRQAFYKLWKESIKAHLKDDNFGEEYKNVSMIMDNQQGISIIDAERKIINRFRDFLVAENKI